MVPCIMFTIIALSVSVFAQKSGRFDQAVSFA